MRVVAAPPPVPWLFLPGHDEVQLIHLRRAPAPPAAWAGLARFPAGWLEVAQSRIESGVQTFVTYHRPGVRPASYHCAALPAAEPSAKPIACVNLGEHRLAVIPAGHGYEARWSAGDVWHRVSGGPADLGGFMELILRLTVS